MGARSALFAPFRDLGLLVVDEEHDDSYKQDEGVPYHARDLAVVLASAPGARWCSASATPSLETWHNAAAGPLPPAPAPASASTPAPGAGDRAGGPAGVTCRPRATAQPLPRAAAVDALPRRSPAAGRPSCLQPPRLSRRWSRVRAASGVHLRVPELRDLASRFHQRGRGGAAATTAGEARVRRDLPGLRRRRWTRSARAPSGSRRSSRELFPGVAMRGAMDADTTAVRGAHAEILDASHAGRTQLLVGTQMVAKGHDFPGCTLGGGLARIPVSWMPDFRASERTFLLVPSSRAGRARPGARAGVGADLEPRGRGRCRVAAHDYEGFTGTELPADPAGPPFTRLVLIRVDGVDRQAVLTARATWRAGCGGPPRRRSRCWGLRRRHCLDWWVGGGSR